MSPQMTGVAPLHCGSASFHAMFSVGLHLTGRFFSPLTPSPAGPRHAGQLAEMVTLAVTISDKMKAHLRIEYPGSFHVFFFTLTVGRMLTSLRSALGSPV